MSKVHRDLQVQPDQQDRPDPEDPTASPDSKAQRDKQDDPVQSARQVLSAHKAPPVSNRLQSY